jgi:hypothetical protein
METNHDISGTKLSRVFSFDRGIRFVVLLTSDGKVIASHGRPGVSPLEPASESETVYMRAAIAISMSEPMNKYHGRIRTAILVKEKLTIICFNLVTKIMLITCNPDFRLQNVEKLGQLIDQLNID